MPGRGLQAAMRIRWDEAKRQEVLQRRQIDFTVLHDVLSLPYVEDQRRDDPEQYRVIGFGQGRLITFIIEYRQDASGEYLWVVTAWHATTQESQAYERATR
jgi:uncharacterized DUF497 family protein